MSKGKRELSADERDLWRRVAATVKSRRALLVEEHHNEPVPPLSRKIVKTHVAPPQSSLTVRKSAAPPQNKSTEKRVRRGDVEIGATLDLHGYTQADAPGALSRFLHRAHKRGDRAVVVVTGVGRGGEGVLKRMFLSWLAAKDVRAILSGYAPAHRSHGGAGAFYVFLKHRRDDRA